MRIILLIAVAVLLSSCSHYRHHGGKHRWKAMDTNSDGKVSKAEFTTAHEAKFKAMDANNDGSVTKEEKKAYKKSKCSKDKKSCPYSKNKSDCTEESCKTKK